MPEWILLIIVPVIFVIAAILFGVWIVFSILRGLFRLVVRVISGKPAQTQPTTIAQPMAKMLPEKSCEQPLCQAKNPVDARFCRRCGRALRPPEQVAVRRVAMF